MYRIEGNKLITSKGEPITFEHTIKQSLLVNDTIVVVLETPPKIVYDRNVFAFNTNGDFLWQIGAAEFFYKGKDCPYVGATANEQGQITLSNWCDTAVVVDLITGKILSKYNTK
jgi:hypothetical protein